MRVSSTILSVALVGACSFAPGGGPAGGGAGDDAPPGIDDAVASVDAGAHDAEPPGPPDAPPPDAAPPPPDARVCTDGFTPGPPLVGGCYIYIGRTRRWDQARDDCTGLGGGAHLVTITSPEENAFVHSLIADGGSTIYFGITDGDSEGTYVWVNGEPVGYTNFLPGEGTSPSEDCGEMNPSNGGWYDDQCDNDRPYVCER